MIEKKSTQNEVGVLHGEDKTGRKAGITADSRWILKLLSNIYSDPYGAIIQELVSNGFDANNEANSENNIVEIKFEYDSEYNPYMAIRDYGIGMSPEFMYNKFMDYGESTKRQSNNAIGLFGIGSKSPFAIRDTYEIISYINGVAYYYMMYKDEDEMPSYDLLQESETNEDDGTEVRISIDGDRWKFLSSIKEKLLYFSDVYVHHEEINNHYTIYEFKNFVSRLRLDGTREADICYKRVRYRINYGKLGITTLNEPIGIKFEIGELMPTPSREDITYGDEEVALIKDRIKNALIEVIDYFNDKTQNIFEDFNEYQTAYKSTPEIQLENDLKINVEYCRAYLIKNFDIDYKIKKPQYKFLLDLGFDSGNVDPYVIVNIIDSIIASSLYVYSQIKSGREYKDDKIDVTKYTISESYTRGIINNNQVNNVYVLPLHHKSDGKINKFIENAVIIKPLKKKIYKTIYTAIRKLYHDLNEHINYTDNKPSKIYKHFYKLFRSKLVAYSSIELPQDFEEQLEAQKIARAKMLIFRPRYSQEIGEWKFRYESVTEFIEAFKGIDHNIIYTHDENVSRALNKLAYFNDANRTYNAQDVNLSRKIEVIHLSKKNYDILYKLKLKNFMSEVEFYQTKIFRDFCTAFYLEHKVNKKLNNRNFDILKKLNKDVYGRIKSLKDFITKHTIEVDRWRSKITNEQLNEFKKESSLVAKNFNLLDKTKIEDLEVIDKYLENLEIIRYIDINKFEDHEDYQILVDIFKLKKKRVDDFWYSFLCKTYELELIKESSEKVKYLKSIKKVA